MLSTLFLFVFLSSVLFCFQLIDFLLTDDRTASVDLGSVDGFQLQVDAGESFLNRDEIRFYAEFLYPSYDFFSGESGGESQCGIVDSEVSLYDGYVNPFSNGKHQLRSGTVRQPQFKIINGDNIIQRWIKGNCINHFVCLLCFDKFIIRSKTVKINQTNPQNNWDLFVEFV